MKKLKKYIGTKQFYISVFSLIIPIMIQQLFVSIAGYIDSLMVNSLSENVYNGVSAANRLMFIFNFIWMGFAATSSIFIAQYFGANKKKEVHESVRLSVYIAIIVGLISTIVISLFGNRVVDSFLQNDISRQYGYDYLNVMKYGAIVFAINIAFASGYRSIEKPKVALISAITGIVFNIFLNYTFIFGNFGAPKLEATGAAIGTIVSKCIELLIFIGFLMLNKDSYLHGLFKSLKVKLKFLKEFVLKAIPLVTNEVLWSSGMVLFARFYTYNNEVWYNAYAYSQNISDLFFIIFAGLGTGTAVFVGTKLGRSEFEEAKKECNYFKGLGVIMGISVGALMAITAPLTSKMFSSDAQTLKLVTSILQVTAIFTAIYCYNAVSFFTLRAGGDSIRAFILDQAPSYLIGLPICIILGVNAKNWGLSFITIYLCTHLLDIFKIFLGNYFVKQNRWVKNLTIKEGVLNEEV